MTTFKVWQQFVHNPLRKTPYGLCESCRGSEIYNFPIHHFVHFYSTFESFARSKQGPWARSQAGRRRAVSRCDVVRRACRAVPRPAPPGAPYRGCTVPRPRAPRAWVSRPRRAVPAMSYPPVPSAQQGGEEPAVYKGLSLLVAQGRHLDLALATAGRLAAPVRAARRCQ
jgi:hypothetical protein